MTEDTEGNRLMRLGCDRKGHSYAALRSLQLLSCVFSGKVTFTPLFRKQRPSALLTFTPYPNTEEVYFIYLFVFNVAFSLYFWPLSVFIHNLPVIREVFSERRYLFCVWGDFRQWIMDVVPNFYTQLSSHKLRSPNWTAKWRAHQKIPIVFTRTLPSWLKISSTINNRRNVTIIWDALVYILSYLYYENYYGVWARLGYDLLRLQTNSSFVTESLTATWGHTAESQRTLDVSSTIQGYCAQLRD